eukprot:m.769106 g.769106  ORF g.769106 m.769106 type:complete len:934 (-) comp23235_c0_seq5:6056-8857(-)
MFRTEYILVAALHTLLVLECSGSNCDNLLTDISNATICVVTTTHDSNPGSFRNCLSQFASATQFDTVIRFAIPSNGSESHHTILFNSNALTILEKSENNCLLIDGRSQTGLSPHRDTHYPKIWLVGETLRFRTPVALVDVAVGSVSGDGIYLEASPRSVLQKVYVFNCTQNGIEIATESIDVVIGTSGGAWSDTSFTRLVGNLIGITTDAPRTVIDNIVIGIEGGSVSNSSVPSWAAGNGAGIVISGSAHNTIIGGNGIFHTVISNSGDDGIFVQASNVSIQFCYVGTDMSGTKVMGNDNNGITFARMSENCTISGGTDRPAIVSGNGDLGIEIRTSNNRNISIVNTYIGVGSDGVTKLCNGEGGISSAADNTRIGALNDGIVVVSGNGIRDSYPRDSGNLCNGMTSPGIYCNGDNTVIENTFVGVAADGVTPVPNDGHGISIGSGAIGVRIGSKTSGSRVVCSSANHGYGMYIRGEHVRIANVRVGVDAINGMRSLGNGKGGIYFAYSSADSDVWGENGLTTVSGNFFDGITISADNVNVSGAYIGVSADGCTAVPNTGHGVLIRDGADNVIVGNADNISATVIAGNLQSGVLDSTEDVEHVFVRMGYAADGVTAIPNSESQTAVLLGEPPLNASGSGFVCGASSAPTPTQTETMAHVAASTIVSTSAERPTTPTQPTSFTTWVTATGTTTGTTAGTTTGTLSGAQAGISAGPPTFAPTVVVVDVSVLSADSGEAVTTAAITTAPTCIASDVGEATAASNSGAGVSVVVAAIGYVIAVIAIVIAFVLHRQKNSVLQATAGRASGRSGVIVNTQYIDVGDDDEPEPPIHDSTGINPSDNMYCEVGAGSIGNAYEHPVPASDAAYEFAATGNAAIDGFGEHMHSGEAGAYDLSSSGGPPGSSAGMYDLSSPGHPQGVTLDAHYDNTGIFVDDGC